MGVMSHAEAYMLALGAVTIAVLGLISILLIVLLFAGSFINWVINSKSFVTAILKVCALCCLVYVVLTLGNKIHHDRYEGANQSKGKVEWKN